METLSHWLVEEIKTRDWSMSELARRCGVSHVMISRIISGERKPSPELCTSIAQAFQVPPEAVFRRAGLLPPKSSAEQEEEELLYWYNQMTPEMKRQARAVIRALVEEKESKQASDSQDAVAPSPA